MSFMLLGILNAQAAGGAAGAYDLLESEVLSTSSTSIVFDNLDVYAADYQHLQIRAVVRTDRAGVTSDPVTLQFNADTGSNYSRQGLVGYSTGGAGTITSNSAASQSSIFLSEAVSGATATADSFAAIVADILDPFNASKNTTVRSLTGMSGGFYQIELRSGAWFDTDSITQIQLDPLIGTNFVSASRFSLYGLKKASA